MTENSVISECSYMKFPNKIIQKFYPNENLVKVT